MGKTTFTTATKEFFKSAIFRSKFEGYNRCLTGTGVASLMGISPWESRTELHQRLHSTKATLKKRTWEMERSARFKSMLFSTFEKNSPAEVFRTNPLLGGGAKPLYVCDPKFPGLGGIVDCFLVNRKSGNVCAGMMIRTSGLSSIDYWMNHPTAVYTAQCLFYAGICGGLDWVLSVLLFKGDETGKESIPFEIRSYHLKFDRRIYEKMRNEAINYFETCNEQGISPDGPTGFQEVLDEYLEKNTRLFRIVPPQ